MAHVEQTPNWWVVWYWLDETTFAHKRFMDYDYDDAVAFCKEANEYEQQRES
jgi:hypothetical protein